MKRIVEKRCPVCGCVPRSTLEQTAPELLEALKMAEAIIRDSAEDSGYRGASGQEDSRLSRANTFAQIISKAEGR